MPGEYEWYVALIQYLHLELVSTAQKINEGFAWDIGFVQAVSEADAAAKLKKNPQCNLKAFKIGQKTEVLIHRVELLDAAMVAKDMTPRTRIRRKRT